MKIEFFILSQMNWLLIIHENNLVLKDFKVEFTILESQIEVINLQYITKEDL